MNKLLFALLLCAALIIAKPVIGLVLLFLLLAALCSPNQFACLFTAPSPTIKGVTSILWGTGSTYSTAIVVSARNQLTGEMVEISDNNGFAASVVFFNDKNECEVQIVVQTTAPTLARGDSVTIGGVSGCLVTETELVWEQKGCQKYTIKATKWVNV